MRRWRRDNRCGGRAAAAHGHQKNRRGQDCASPDGTITVDGKTFNSPSRAGKEVIGKEVDGWTFWSYEVEGEGLKKLDTLRKENA